MKTKVTWFNRIMAAVSFAENGLYRDAVEIAGQTRKPHAGSLAERCQKCLASDVDSCAAETNPC